MKLRTVIATATTAAVLSTGGVALAGAATDGGSTPSANPAASTVAATEANRHPVVRHRARVHIRRAARRAGGVVARTIGIDRKTLRQELRSGKTIAEIATAHGVQPQTVIDALVNAANQRIDRAVTNGHITAERAAKLKERVSARVTRIVNEWHPRRARTGTGA